MGSVKGAMPRGVRYQSRPRGQRRARKHRAEGTPAVGHRAMPQPDIKERGADRPLPRMIATDDSLKEMSA